MEIWRLFAHNHWFKVNFFGKELRLCARCTGYSISLLILSVINNLNILIFLKTIDINLKIFLCFLLIIPLSFDWLTQSLRWRESNNKLRLITGAISGIGVFIFLSIQVAPTWKEFYSIYIATFLMLFSYAKWH